MMEKKQDYTVSYAQNYEDRIIEAFFPDINKGVYVDVGANHPFYHSVTKIFYDKGWRGINIEPNPMLFNQLAEKRPEDNNLMIGVGDKQGSFDLRVYHSKDGLEGISTLSSQMKDNYSINIDKDTKNFSDVTIQVDTLKRLFTSQKVEHIHFMKVDVEGFEYEVLQGNDWKKFRPELICIEANHMMKDWRPMLKKANYTLVFNDGLNDYYLAQEAADRVDNFDYAKVILSSKPVLQFDTAERIRSLVEQNETAQSRISYLEEVKTKLETENELQRRTIEEIGSLTNHARKAIKSRLSISKEKED
jgi:FkbM family methyltransferase